MNFDSITAFVLAMTLLAASPGPGLAAILSRAATSGRLAGYRVVIGLVLVDFLFLAVAIIGLSAISVALGPLFQVVKYLAAAYLIYLGVQSIKKAASNSVSIENETNDGSALKDVMLGCLVTLGNPKAILFYGAFLPAFFDVEALALQEFIVICGLILLISAVVYGSYISLFARSLRLVSGRKVLKRIQKVSGLALVGSGVMVAAR